jgi:hypothetical protein
MAKKLNPKKGINPKNPSPKKLKKLDEVAEVIFSEFHHCFPWMYLLFLRKEGKHSYLFHFLSSLPVFNITAQEDALLFTATWEGTNAKEFVLPDYKEEATKSVLGESEEKIASAWNEIAKSKYHKFKSNNYASFPVAGRLKNKKYKAKSAIMFRSVRSIDIYSWGFEIITASNINAIGIKGKAFRNLFEFANLEEVDHELLEYVCKNVALSTPTQLKAYLDLRYFWTYSSGDISDDEMDKILGDSTSGDEEDILDIGQRTSRNILLE